MKVQTTNLHDGTFHIVFDNCHGIEIDEFEAECLRLQLQAWKDGDIYEFLEGESSLVFVELPRDENDSNHLYIAFGNVWYEIPVATGMELLNGLENPVRDDDDTEDAADGSGKLVQQYFCWAEEGYADAAKKYFRWAEEQPGLVNQPSNGLSEYRDGKWYLANVNGPLATVDQCGEVQPAEIDDANWE